MRVRIATCRTLPEPDPDSVPLTEALTRRGVDFEVVAWDDPSASWDAPGATVVVTDANGTQFSVAAGTNGNFYRTTSTKIAFPIHAEVHANGKILKMNDAINNGDCNACHTTLGTNKAPGRIVAS